MKRTTARLGTVLPTILVLACAVSPGPQLDLRALNWAVHRSDTLGYEISYPDIFTAEDEEGTGGVIFRHNGTRGRVIFLDAEEGRNRGLWVRHEPVGSIELGGLKGQQYIYYHWDLFIYARTVAFVVPLRGKFLALQFETTAQLTAVQKRMLDSFRFVETPAS